MGAVPKPITGLPLLPMHGATLGAIVPVFSIAVGLIQLRLHRHVGTDRILVHQTRVGEEVDGVLERRQRHAQGLPDPRRGQHDGQVLQHLHLGVDHRAGVTGEGQHVVERTYRLPDSGPMGCRAAPVSAGYSTMAGHTETNLVGSPGWML